MAEPAAFAELLEDKSKSDLFDLHQVQRDCNGVEKAIKVDKQQIAQKTKMTAMAEEVTDAIFDQTFNERIKWIEDERKQGNALFKQEKFPAAIDQYMKCLCALDFKSCKGYLDETTELPRERDAKLDKSLWITKEREKMAQLSMKVPCLNNMAQCLIRMNQFERAIDMLDQVLSINDKNSKATARKISCLIQLGHCEKAEKIVRYATNTIDTYNSDNPADIQLLRQTLVDVRKQLAEKKIDDRKFMENVFKKSGSLYEDKEDVKTPEELAETAEERRLAMERMEEAEYLETLNNFHWLVYPWFKMLERGCDKIFGCKKKLTEENQKRREEVAEKQQQREKTRRRQLEELKKQQ